MTTESAKNCQARTDRLNQNCCDYGCDNSHNCPAHRQMLKKDRVDKALETVQWIAFFILVLTILINFMDFML